MIFRRRFGTDKRAAVETPEFALGDQSAFWSWFKANAAALAYLNTEKDRERNLVNVLHDAVTRYSEELGILVGVDPDGINELIVSADGILANIPIVLELLREKPIIPGWKFTALKQRSPGTGAGFGGQTVRFEEVRFTSEISPDGDVIHIQVVLPYRPGLSGSDERFLTYLLLDNLLGEFDVATFIGAIEVRMLGPDEVVQGRVLTELVDEVDNLPGRGRLQ